MKTTKPNRHRPKKQLNLYLDKVMKSEYINNVIYHNPITNDTARIVAINYASGVICYEINNDKQVVESYNDFITKFKFAIKTY